MLDNIRIEKIIWAPISAKIFFWRFQLYWMLDVVPSCNLVQYQENVMTQLEKMAKTVLDPVWDFSMDFTSTGS